jgi:UDP:flavonoid glycosyltransferase YjiC (YdhE family)
MRMLVACSLGGSGHLRPLLPFLAAADRRRSEVLLVGPPALEEMVRATGYPFLAGGEPAESEVAPIRERLPVAPPGEAAHLANRELFGRLATDAMLPTMETACREWHPDLVVREPCEYSSAVIAATAGIPIAQVAISTAQVEQASIATAAGALEAHRRGLVEELRAMPYLTRFPATLDPSPFRSTFRYRDDNAAARPLPEWWGDRDGPLIYVSFGTVLGYMSMAAAVYRTVLDAVSVLTGARVLLTIGTHFDPSCLGPAPDNVHVEPWVDQSDVLSRADLVVCHGGSGTVLGALGAGVPVVAVPVFADQDDNARLVAEAGAGSVVRCGRGRNGATRAGIGKEDVPRITQAIEAVLEDPRYRADAQRVAEEMASAPTADAALAGLVAGPEPTVGTGSPNPLARGRR